MTASVLVVRKFDDFSRISNHQTFIRDIHFGRYKTERTDDAIFSDAHMISNER